MKLTDDISTSPHAAATQVGDETVIVIMSRDASLALAAPQWAIQKAQ